MLRLFKRKPTGGIVPDPAPGLASQFLEHFEVQANAEMLRRSTLQMALFLLEHFAMAHNNDARRRHRPVALGPMHSVAIRPICACDLCKWVRFVISRAPPLTNDERRRIKIALQSYSEGLEDAS